jgi:Flp pilus assembly protein TadG
MARSTKSPAPRRAAERAAPRRPFALWRLIADRRGVTSVQLALVLPALLAAIMGVIDMGRMLMTQNTLVHAANEAARYAMVRSASSDQAASEQDIVTLVKGRMPGLDPDRAVVAVNWAPANQPGGRVTVSVNYPYALSALGMGVVNLNGSSSTFITH